MSCMRILICGDSHGNVDVLDAVVKKHPDIDLYLHTGDSEASSELALLPFRAVLGNCDYFGDFPEHLLIPTPLGNIWVQHHPETRLDPLKKAKVKFFIHGHTHVRRNEEKDGIVFINPGSISRPFDSPNGTYAILEIKNNQFEIKFYTVE